MFDYIGLPLCEINKQLNHRKAEHTFYITSTQFKLCTEKIYQELICVFNIDKMKNFKLYPELKNINSKFEPTFNLEGLNKKSNVLSFKKEYKTLHPTQKPVSLMEYLIKTYTNENDIVLDFAMGSGTTGVACKNTNRNFLGIELDENYFKIAHKRIII
jgi:site-specific DNA-methyltransferase (adenine-specific)